MIMVSSAVLLALVTMITWGLWAVFADLATRTLLPSTTTLVSYAAAVVVTSVYVGVTDKPISPTNSGVSFAVLAGVASAIGVITLYTALSRGNAAVVTTISALYFVVAAAIGVFFLGDSIALTDAVGLALAVVAILFLTL